MAAPSPATVTGKRCAQTIDALRKAFLDEANLTQTKASCHVSGNSWGAAGPVPGCLAVDHHHGSGRARRPRPGARRGPRNGRPCRAGRSPLRLPARQRGCGGALRLHSLALGDDHAAGGSGDDREASLAARLSRRRTPPGAGRVRTRARRHRDTRRGRLLRRPPAGPDDSHVVSGLPVPDRVALDPPASRPLRVPPAAKPDGIDVSRHVVSPGDTLWQVAAGSLPAAASDADIDRRWRDIWSENQAEIGPDPDLIHPGTTLHLPLKKES